MNYEHTATPSQLKRDLIYDDREIALRQLRDLAFNLLDKYNEAQDKVIWEFSYSIKEDEEKLEREIERYSNSINNLYQKLV